VRLLGPVGLTAKKLAASRFLGFSSDAWLSGLGLCLLFVALRWNNCTLPLSRDEGEYAYSAQLLQRGLAPYEHAFLQKPPMVVYTYALAGAVAPNVFWFPRLLACVSIALATCLLGLIARLEFGPGVALPAMWLLTPMILLPGLEQFTANTEMFMLLPLLATLAVFARSRHRRSGSADWCVAGFLGATALCYKYTAFPLLALTFSAWSFREWQASRSARALCVRGLFGAFGAAVASAAALGLFVARDGGKRLWECTVLFNRYYAASSGFGMAGLWYRLQLFWADWWILFLLPAVLVFRRERRVWFWLGMFAAAWLATGAAFNGHYYVVVMPFWALLAVVAIRGLASAAAAKLAWSPDWLRRAFTTLAVVLVCLPDVPWVICSKEKFAAEKLAAGNPFLESAAVARRVAELTAPRDYVFVAGSEPQILYYARRLSPSRFVIVYPLMIPTPLAESYQQEAIRDLERRPPAVIVLARSGMSWLRQEATPPDFARYLEKLLVEHYERVGGWVEEGQRGHWQEPLPEPAVADSSLVLFRRKGQ
jgi:hypothetical protein